MTAVYRFGLWTLVVSVLAPAGAAAVGFENHRVVARGAIDVLPEAIAPLFELHRDALVERAVEPEAVWPRDRVLRQRASWHRVPLDLDAEEQTRAARLKAAERFPRSESIAQKAYRARHLSDEGILPWAVERLFHDLVQAFAEGKEEDVIRAAGHLTHFACDCASPFNATADFDGRLTQNLYLGSLEPGDDGYAHQSVQYRCDLELVRRNAARYAEQIRVGRSDYDPVIEAPGRAFEVLLRSLGRIDEVATADNEILQRLDIGDGKGFAARADEYYVLLDERCGDLYVERLRDGVVLAGSLIGGAWEAAGRPSPDQIRARAMFASGTAPADESRAVEPNEGSGSSGGGFVGSKSSKVFHRPDCRHVERISAGNRVTFKTAKEAIDQGRRPCKTCDPHD